MRVASGARIPDSMPVASRVHRADNLSQIDPGEVVTSDAIGTFHRTRATIQKHESAVIKIIFHASL